MLRFRKKILFRGLLLLVIFVALLYPFVESAVGHIMRKRTSLPSREIRQLAVDFEIGFLLLGAFLLVLYSIITWVIIHRLSRPIQEIIDAIAPYQEGREEFLPRIALSPSIQGDEFTKLAFTLNSLTEKIQGQIENATRQKRQTEGILESLGEGVIAFSASAKVTFANEVACRMLGSSHGAIMNQSFDEIKARSKDLVAIGHELVLKTLQTMESAVATWTGGEGRRMALDLIAAPLAQQSGVVLVLQDKTSDYKMLEMGKDFIANASHELRTPITIIRGFAETLQDLPELTQEMLHEITEKIVRTCARLDKLVKSLLTLSDIENLSVEQFRACDLILLVDHCKQLLLAAHPEAELAMKSGLARALVAADADLLDLAIMNLLENAVKYSHPPAQIQISVEGAANEICLSVSDRGIGIPEADLPHIFDRFYTVDKARSRKSGGAGLGLSIVKTIVEKHKGSVRVTSKFGEGSTFTIALPQEKRSSRISC